MVTSTHTYLAITNGGVFLYAGQFQDHPCLLNSTDPVMLDLCTTNSYTPKGVVFHANCKSQVWQNGSGSVQGSYSSSFDTHSSLSQSIPLALLSDY